MQQLLSNIKQYRRATFIVLFAVFLIVSYQSFQNKPAPAAEPVAIFSEYDFSAKAVYILDKKTGEVIHSENSSEVFEIASITKVMTALVALEEYAGETIKITDSAFESFGDTGLLRDESWKTEDLVAFMLVNSSNDAAEALAIHYPRGREKFIERMNDRARELGLETLQFQNPTGLNEVEEYGGIGSSEEIADLFAYTTTNHPEIFEGTRKSYFEVSSLDSTHLAENTNLAANALSGLTAGKTGYTDKSGGSLVVEFNLGLDNPVIAVVLGTDGREERFSDMIEVIKATSHKALFD